MSVNRVVEGGWLFVIRVRAGDVVFVRRGTERRGSVSIGRTSRFVESRRGKLGVAVVNRKRNEYVDE